MTNVDEYARKVRESRGYIQEYVAAKMGISQSVYCKIECGKQKMGIGRLMRRSEILDVAVERLLTLDNVILPSKERNSHAISTLRDSPDFNDELNEKLIDQLELKNKRLVEQNKALFEMLKNILPNIDSYLK